MISLVGNSLGLIIGSAFSDTKVAAGMMPACVVPFMLFGGFFANRDNLFVGIRWFEYVSPFKYGFDAHINNNFEESNFLQNPIDLFNLDFVKKYYNNICYFLIIIFKN